MDVGGGVRADGAGESVPPTPGADPSASRPWWDLARLIGLALAVIVLARMLGRLEDVLGLVLLAGTIALLTDPLRRRLARRTKPGAAVALTALATLATIVVLGVVLFRDLASQSERLADELVERIEDLRPGTLPARVADSLDAADGVRDVLDRLPALVVAGEDDAAGVGRQLIDTLLVVILAAFFQGGIANVVDGVVRRWPRHERKAVRDLLGDVERRGGGYVRRSVLLGVAAAVAVAAACWAWGVPGGVLLGCWVGAWSAVPWFGWLIGAAPLVVTAFADGRREGIAITVVAAALVTLTSLARRRLVERHELRLGPALTVLAFAAGIAAAGFGGLLVCLVGVALAGAVLTSPHTVVRPYSTEPPPDEPVDDERRADVPRGARALLRPSADGGAVLIAPGWRGAATVVGGALAGVLVWMVAGRVGVVTVWVVVGGLVAIALSRPVGWVQRRLRVPRVAAVALVFTVAVGVVAAAVAAGVAGGATTSSRLSEELPTIVEDLETAPLIGSWLRDRDAATWVSDQMNDLPQRLEEARDVSEWLPTVGARVLDLFWTVLIALALLLDGPRLVAAVERRVAARRRRQFSRLVDVSQRAIGGYLAGAAIVAGLNATVVFVIAIALGVALAPVLAVWAFIWNFVPQIGGFMGGFPLVVLALAVGPVQAILAGTLFVTYQFIENHLIQPAVISEAIDVPPWVTLLAALAGGAAAGVVGAVVLTPLVGVVRVVLLEVRRRDFPGNTVPLDPLVEPAPDPVGV